MEENSLMEANADMAKRLLAATRRIIAGRLRNKLIVTFSLMVAFIVILLTYLSFRQTVIINEQNFIVGNRKIVKLINQNLDGYMNQIDELSLSPRKDSQFMDSLLSSEYLAQFYIQNTMKNMFYSREDIEAIDIYTPRNRQSYTISRSGSSLVQGADSQMEQQAWYREAMRSPHFRSIEPGLKQEAAGSNRLLTFHRIVINIADKSPLAAISITLNFHEFDRITRDLSDHAGEFIGLYNQDNKPLYQRGPELAEADLAYAITQVKDNAGDAGYSALRFGHKDYVLIDHISAALGWKLIKLTPMQALNQEAANARRFNLTVGIVLLVFFIVIVVIVSGAITRRLLTFSRRIEKLGEGHFVLDDEIKGTDEIAHLSRKFNRMVVKINDLIAERYEIKLNERNARLKALEAQINPHFLYNSLQAISTEAIVSEMESIQLMVDALASSLRYCIKDGETVRVSEELEHIRNYLLLQHARFGARLSESFDLDEEALACFIPKMSLQILLENAMEHALEQMSGVMLLTIQAEEWNGQVVLRVTDNGPGIAPERLQGIRDSLNENYFEYHGQIGLKNLYSRLKLLFGSEASLQIMSEPDCGTSVEIRLPARREMHHVHSALD